MNYTEIYNNIVKEATAHAFAEAGENVMIFPCGFASIRFPKKDYKADPFVKWLLAEKIADSDPVAKCYYIWVGSCFNQSHSHKVAYAEKFVQLILEYLENKTVYTWDNLD